MFRLKSLLGFDPQIKTDKQSPQATVSTIAQNSAEKDINVRRSSTEVGIIIGALIAFGVISFSLLLLYRRRSDHSCNPLAWWRKRKTPAEPAEVEISDPMTTRGAVSDDESTLHDTYDNKLNESQQDLVPKTPEGQPKPTIVQKIQKALYGALNQALKKKSKQEPNPVDMEKGQSSDTLDEGISNKPNVSTSGDEWGRRPVSAADMSIQTESSMALHPAVTRLKSQKKSGPRPGVSAFSWSTTAPTSVPPIRASLGENPLPPLPSDRDSRRDTALTTMTEDSGPVRHMSVTGWVTNMQKRQQKREQRLQQPTSNDGEAALPTDLLAPAAVADPKGRQWTSKDTGSVRSSTITLETNAKTPALETATLAWHVHRGAGQVDVPPIPRSMGRRQNEEPESQNLNAKYREEAVYPQEEQYGQQYEYAQQDGAYSREVQYAQQDEYAYQGEHAQQADYSQQEQDYPQEHDPQQREDLQEQYEHQEQQDYSQQYSQREQEQQQEEYYQQQQYRHQDHDGTTPEIHINSPSEATAIPEEEWIPNITRYPSGTTTTTAGNGAAAGPSPRISLSSQREIK
ncbi:hypothetical protein GJ744_010080 [Endocarpon pusillum]|uniref:Uncharacterized protein n=1 Tax=Endocarpon pusillum TaxID=364733 RepID=A0A8H7AGP9_9EURO|nr:hypothetical protein GJ744_010080 [Endocarpon pusillum]